MRKKSLSGSKRTLVIENLLHNLKNSHSRIQCIHCDLYRSLSIENHIMWYYTHSSIIKLIYLFFCWTTIFVIKIIHLGNEEATWFIWHEVCIYNKKCIFLFRWIHRNHFNIEPIVQSNKICCLVTQSTKRATLVLNWNFTISYIKKFLYIRNKLIQIVSISWIKTKIQQIYICRVGGIYKLSSLPYHQILCSNAQRQKKIYVKNFLVMKMVIFTFFKHQVWFKISFKNFQKLNHSIFLFEITDLHQRKCSC